MNSKIHNNYDDALDFLSYLERRLNDSPETSGWSDFLNKARQAVRRVDECELNNLVNSHEGKIEDWVRMLIAGYCLCCIGFGCDGFSLLVQAYNLDKTTLTLGRVYDFGLDLRKIDQLYAIANKDLACRTPAMPRESRLTRAWIQKENQNFSDSEKDYLILIQDYPDDTEVLLQYSGLLVAQGRHFDAVKIYQKINSEDVEVLAEMYQGLSFCHIALGHYDMAKSAIEKGLALNSEDEYLKELKQSL